MCKEFSCIVTEDCKSFWFRGVWGHSEILKKAGLPDRNADNPAHAKIEITNDKKDFSVFDLETWDFGIDEEVKPKWWSGAHKEQALIALGEYIKEKFQKKGKVLTVRSWYENGSPWVVETYKNGKLEGKREEWCENGSPYVVENWENGKLEGKREVWYSNGSPYVVENWKNGKRHGKRESWYENGSPCEVETYKNGKREGKREEWYSSGSPYEVENWKNGKRL